jgi:hypothetical protein
MNRHILFPRKPAIVGTLSQPPEKLGSDDEIRAAQTQFFDNSSHFFLGFPLGVLSGRINERKMSA